MNDITIPIHASKGSKCIAKTIPLNQFIEGFRKKFYNGEINRCYYTRYGNLNCCDIWDRTLKYILLADESKRKKRKKASA